MAQYVPSALYDNNYDWEFQKWFWAYWKQRVGYMKVLHGKNWMYYV